MRKQSLAFLVIPVLAIAATSQGQGTPAPVRGGTLTVAMNVEPAALDPTQVAGAEIQRMIYQNVLEGLLGIDEKGKVVPALATGLPKVSSDGTEYTFKLRSGVKFHDGSPFSSSDVKVKFDFARTKDSGQQSPTYYEGITSVTAPDPLTVVFKLSKVNTDFVFNMARNESVIEPGETYSTAAGRDKLKVAPVGTGPFKLKAWNRGTSVVLERNPDYYVKGLPYLDGVTFRFLGDDQNAKITGLRSGDIDVIPGLVAEQASILKADPNFKVTVGASSGEITVSMNNQRKPFSDIRVRQALTYAMNKRELVDGGQFGFGTVIGSFNSPGQPYFIDLANRMPYNPEKAKALLKAAGYGDGLKFKFTVANEFPIERRTAEIYAAELEKIGVTAEIELVPFNVWIQKVFLGKDYDMTIIGHAEGYDLDRYARDGYYFNWDNKEYKALQDKALVTVNDAARTRIYYQMQDLLVRQAPGIWAFSAASITASRANVYGLWASQPVANTNLIRVFKTK
jgi:peptide/nickel transport system substrate-binding protein